MSNYKAIVAKIDKVMPIQGADNIQIAKVLGETVIVSKELQPDYVGLFFCAGCQLSEDFVINNNLFRDSGKNKDSDKKGFFDNNRKVRAQPFMKVKSEGYFTSLESLFYIDGVDISLLQVGDTFDELNSMEICRKFIVKEKRKNSGTPKAKKKREVPLFEKHVDTAQFRHKLQTIEKGGLISIQAKVHGTSQRVGLLPVDISGKLSWWKKLLNKVGPFFTTEEYQVVVGTRNVILDDPEKESFHGKEGFRFEIANMLEPYLEKGMTIYGEVAGYANGQSIMPPHNIEALKDKKYTKKYGKDPMVYKYGCVQDSYRFHIYRITMTTEEGNSIDFTQPQLVQWCTDRGLLPSLDVCEPFIFDGDYEALNSKVECLGDRLEELTEDYIDHSHISEGVIVRLDNGNRTPTFLKYKSYAFRVCEGICEAEDPEDYS